MILVDTSVLIDYLSGKQAKHVLQFDDILNRSIPFGINQFIYLELLQGASTEREFNLLKVYLETLKFYEINKLESFNNAAKIFYLCKKKGITVRSTIDCLVVQTCLDFNLSLLHNDRDFINISKVITDLRFF
jgi:predicted nucleic acid-binding protein